MKRSLRNKLLKKQPTVPMDDQSIEHGVKKDNDPSQASKEWGDRHATGIAIARGGKTTGHVPGAMEQRR